MNKEARARLKAECEAKKALQSGGTVTMSNGPGKRPIDVPMDKAVAIASKQPKPAKVPGPAYTPPKPKKPRWVEHGRLPDRSMFSLTYDAAKEQWIGTLLIGSGDASQPCKFEGTCSGVFRLLRQLDQAYRRSLPQTKDAAT